MTGRIRGCIVVLLAAAMLLPPAASGAQETEPRDRGVFVALTVGWGVLSYDGFTGSFRSGEGVGGLLPRAGYRLGPTLALGLQVHGFVRPGPADPSYGGVQAFMEWAPTWSGNVRFATGAGYDRLSWDAEGNAFARDVSFRDEGFGVSLSAIYDWRLSRDFALSPYVSFQNGWLHRYGARVYSAGLGFTLW